MAANDYHFITHWRVEGDPEEVYRILEDAADLPRWWPAVYLEVKEIEPVKEGQPSVFDLYTKSWLPYTLRWQFRTVEQIPFQRLELEAWGDFTGRGLWTFYQDGAWVDVTYDWKIRANKPLLRRLSFLLEPVFAANHRWAMSRGEESLKLELARRRAATPQERARVPAPPGPTTNSPVPLLVGLLGTGLGLAAGIYWFARLLQELRKSL